MVKDKISVIGFRIIEIRNKYVIVALLSSGVENKIAVYKNRLSAEETLASIKALIPQINSYSAFSNRNRNSFNHLQDIDYILLDYSKVKNEY